MQDIDDVNTRIIEAIKTRRRYTSYEKNKRLSLMKSEI